jgi:hypothetical protein
VASHREQLLFDEVGDRRFARAGQSGEPDNAGILVLQVRALALGDRERLPRDVGSAPERKSDHAGANRPVVVAIDQDERSGTPVLLVC